MKKSTAIILILIVLVVALATALIYEMKKEPTQIIINQPSIIPEELIETPPVREPEVGKVQISISGEIQSGEYIEQNHNEDKFIDESGEKITQIEPEVAIIKEEVPLAPKDKKVKIDSEYDLIVFGADPEGIATAVRGARSGLKTLLVEKKDGPGGLFTYGMLNTIDVNTGVNGEFLNGGIFTEIYNKLGSNSFDIAQMKDVLNELLDKEKNNLTTLYNVKNISVFVDQPESRELDDDVEIIGNKKIKYVKIDNKNISALAYIDCTPDADIAVSAGAEYTIGWEDMNEKGRSMSATLVFKMDNVDWDKMCEFVKQRGLSNEGYSNTGIWAFGDITKEYVPTEPHMRLKALNIGKQKDGSILINSLQVLNVDTLDEKQKQTAYNKCTKEAENVANYLISKIPGLENAKFAGVADELYVRETRHIVGEEKLTVQDILESKRTSRDVAMASYPIDVQTTSIYDFGYIIANPKQYYISFGCTVPKGFGNLLVCSKCSSYSSIAAGSARVVPTGMSLGEAGALATAMCKQRSIDFQEILNNISYSTDLQDMVRVSGGILYKKSLPTIEKNEKNYSMIIEMCEKGILSLGYENKFDQERIMSENEFVTLVKTYLKRSFIRNELWNTDHINMLDVTSNPVTPNRVKEIIYDITTYNVKDDKTKDKIENFLNIVVPQSKEELTNSRVYEILIGFKDFLVREKV